MKKIDWSAIERETYETYKELVTKESLSRQALSIQVMIAYPGMWLATENCLRNISMGMILVWSEHLALWIPYGPEQST